MNKKDQKLNHAEEFTIYKIASGSVEKTKQQRPGTSCIAKCFSSQELQFHDLKENTSLILSLLGLEH